MLRYIAPPEAREPTVVLLTPGVYNSAYFEHSFLARSMGIEIVEGRDLVAQDGCVFMRTTKGLKPVDVIYRRINDDFLDPRVFRKDSGLGVPGLVDAYRRGQREPGQFHRHRRGRRQGDLSFRAEDDPLLPRRGSDPAQRPDLSRRRSTTDRAYILEHLPELVVKAANESGGYGMLIGSQATRRSAEKFASPDQERSAQLHRAADRRPLPFAVASATIRSRVATSICGLTFSMARR